jgi:hypothetical protein
MHEYEDQESEDRQRELTRYLHQIAAIDAATGASADVRARLLREVRAVRRERRLALAKMYALAAGLLIATAVPVWQLSTRSAGDVPIRLARVAGDIEVATAFYPLIYSNLPVTQGNIVRLEVPATAFASLGVEPVDWAGPQPDIVLADVLVGEDGLARAVRFVRRVTDDFQQEQRP